METEIKTSRPWENIVSILWKNRSHFGDLLTDESKRIRIQFVFVFLIFAAVSGMMTVVNILTGWDTLMLGTLVFSVANFVNLGLTLINRTAERLAQILFAFEIMVLFAFFIISGEPEGFSAIWIVLLPTCGLLLYRLKAGTVISALNLLNLVFLLWTPHGQSLLQYRYTGSFSLRFPLLYIASFTVGLFFELIRSNTQQKLSEARLNYEQLSKHDPLTRLYNRLGFYSQIGENRMLSGPDGCGFAIIDFDNFKSVNDSRGHLAGDVVLRETAELVSDIVRERGYVCRWGGDEVAVFFHNRPESEALCADIVTRVRGHEYRYGDSTFRVTVSIGLTTVEPGETCGLNELIAAADSNLYVSKNSGKDRVNISKYKPPFDKQE